MRRVIATGALVLMVLLVNHVARAALVEVEVTIKSVDLQSRQITVAYKTTSGPKTIDLDVSRKAEITANGKTVSLDSLTLGDRATVTFERELQIVTKIVIRMGGKLPSLVKGNEDRPFVVTVGPMKTLMQPGSNGLFFFPDQCVQVISRHPLAYVMVSKNSTYLMMGRSFGEAKPVQRLLEPGRSGEFDSGYAGAGGLYHLSDRKEWLLFYHAEDHEGMGRNPRNNIPFGYWSVGMAVFNEHTKSVTKLGQVLRASIPKNPNAGNHGVGDTVVVPDPTGKYLYLYYFDLTRRNQSPGQIGVARCAISDGGRPGKWFKYCDGDFSEPGLGGRECGIVTRAWSPTVRYVRSFDCYVMMCDRVYRTDAERDKPQDGGIHWCYSKDGINWSEPQLAVPGLPLPFVGRNYTAHASLVIEHESEEAVTGTLLYAYTPGFGKTPANGGRLVCRSITFTKRDTLQELPDPLPQTWPRLKELYGKGKNIEMSKYGEVIGGDLSQQRLTPLDIRALASLRIPRWLVAQNCEIADEAAVYLADLPRLQRLDLRGNPITDKSVNVLCELKELTELNIHDTKISPEGLRRLRNALPSCQVVGP